jgi:hypothetical protein
MFSFEQADEVAATVGLAPDIDAADSGGNGVHLHFHVALSARLREQARRETKSAAHDVERRVDHSALSVRFPR